MRLASRALVALSFVVAAASVGHSEEPRLRDEDAAVEAAVRAAVAKVSPSIVEVETLGAMPEKVEPPKAEESKGGTTEGVLAKAGFKQAFGPSTGIAVGKDLVLTSTFPLQREPRHVFVTRADGKSFVARVLGRDEARAIALLRVEGADLTPAPVAKRDSIQVGRFALALGRGLGVPEPTVSVGLVSATDRIGGKAVQTSAAVSPKNYGGPLVSLDGEVMGILAPLAPMGGMAGVDLYDSGIGFAATLEDVLALLPRLEKGEKLKPAFLGIGVDQARTEDGALVEQVAPGSPAEKAGLKPKDVIVEVDGVKVVASSGLQQALGRKLAGDKVKLKVDRKGKTEELQATLVEPPARPKGPPHPPMPKMPGPGPGPQPGPHPGPGQDEDR